jgi:four helix bundle protein
VKVASQVFGARNFTSCGSTILYSGTAAASLAEMRQTSQKVRGVSLSESKLRTQSLEFAVEIINLVKELKLKKETIISNQIGRSGTSIGANIREAQYAHGKADFIAKLQIALKEANETGYWLELLYRTDYLPEESYRALDSACARIRVMLIASINTAKANR